ncbi:hypothetical protein VE02_06736 [Pseudogymnoascus sp. 03VT05]|nr:hypothetical protein VE02_06736 [Pseudogymnoascus sp. 03VT05]
MASRAIHEGLGLTVSEVFWPLDLLPEDCPDARILTWGYESNISRFFAGPANQNTILAHARDLLYALESIRRDCRTRNLIFVTHSLGGIIVQDVLCRAAEEQDDSLLHIFKATQAAFFFGKPHRGSGYAEAGAKLQKIAHRTGFSTNDQNIQALQVGSFELEIVHERFMKLYQRNPRPFEVYTFQEAQGLTGVRLLGLGEKVVGNVSSAFTEAERCQTINSNHTDMVRFSSRYDADYEKIASEL